MNFKNFIFTIFLILTVNSAYCINLKNLMAPFKIDIAQVRSLMQQGAGQLSFKAKANFNHFCRTFFKHNSITYGERAYGAGMIVLFSGWLCFMSHFFSKTDITEILDQKEEHEFAVFLSYIGHYFSLIINKTGKIFKYGFGGITIAAAIYMLANVTICQYFARRYNN